MFLKNPSDDGVDNKLQRRKDGGGEAVAALHWQEDLGYILKLEMSRFPDGLDVEGREFQNDFQIIKT